MTNTAIKNEQFTQFDIQRAITFSKLFSRIKLSPTARLVLRCLVDHWNTEKMFCFPSQDTIVAETGASLRSVKNAIQELRKENIILTEIKNSLNYTFTTKFFALVNIAPSQCRKCTLPGAEIAPKQRREKINKKEFSNFKGNFANAKTYAINSAQKTKEDILKPIQAAKEGSFNSIMNLTRVQALEFLRNTAKINHLLVHSSKNCQDLIKKFNVKNDEINLFEGVKQNKSVESSLNNKV